MLCPTLNRHFVPIVHTLKPLDHLVVAVWLTIQGARREGLRHLEEVRGRFDVGRMLWTLPRALNTLLWLHDFSPECHRGPGCCSDNGMQRTSGAPSGLRGAGSVSANAATSNSAA